MNELDKLREEIDRTDAEIVRSFETRMQLARQVAEYKLEHSLPVLDRGREQEVLRKRIGMLQNDALEGDVQRLFELIMQLSRAQQRKVTLAAKKTEKRREAMAIVAAFQGERGANSEAALQEVFGEIKRVNFQSFEDVFAAVSEGTADFGVVPVENSSTGGIAEVYDLLLRYPVFITGEYALPIDHCLVALPGAKAEEIREVYSHEQALLQCGPYLNQLPGAKLIPYFNTAVSAKYVAESGDVHKAAVASAYAARLYGLETLACDISSETGNTTRFLVISASEPQDGNADKASVCFVLEHKAGALAHALAEFARCGLNMVKIESRPIRARKFEYVFYVDFEGINIKENLEKARKGSGDLFVQFKILGTYQAQTHPE